MRHTEYNSPQDFNYTYDGRVLSITGARDTGAIELNVPPVIDGHPVAVIGNGAFTFCHRLKKITVPDTVTMVDNSAFKGCENLVEAILSKDLTVIGALAFAGCENLKRITISNHTDRVELNSFKGCRSLEIVTVKFRESQSVPCESREFAVASESDEAIWLYLRAIMRATDLSNGYMDKYDATFLEIKDEDDQYRVAVHRLMNPKGMTDAMIKIYQDALKGMVTSIIRMDQVDRLTMIGELECIEMEMMSEYIDIASRMGGGCIAYLLDHQNRLAPAQLYDFSL